MDFYEGNVFTVRQKHHFGTPSVRLLSLFMPCSGHFGTPSVHLLSLFMPCSGRFGTPSVISAPVEPFYALLGAP